MHLKVPHAVPKGWKQGGPIPQEERPPRRPQAPPMIVSSNPPKRQSTPVSRKTTPKPKANALHTSPVFRLPPRVSTPPNTSNSPIPKHTPAFKPPSRQTTPQTSSPRKTIQKPAAEQSAYRSVFPKDPKPAKPLTPPRVRPSATKIAQHRRIQAVGSQVYQDYMKGESEEDQARYAYAEQQVQQLTKVGMLQGLGDIRLRPEK